MASEGNMKAANQTYGSFIGFVKWGTIVSVALAALVVLLISS
ncbi:cytochrome C oxidase subunit IV [Sphingobium sp. Leaf26]|nr:aa3-type cytochrome c oxidase subunit IV [Sphingobium sp. Leaf26]KQN10013.1 cytochrome C oxidase subunit IV [Sphingobium sp. Leaf26]